MIIKHTFELDSEFQARLSDPDFESLLKKEFARKVAGTIADKLTLTEMVPVTEAEKEAARYWMERKLTRYENEVLFLSIETFAKVDAILQQVHHAVSDPDLRRQLREAADLLKKEI